MRRDPYNSSRTQHPDFSTRRRAGYRQWLILPNCFQEVRKISLWINCNYNRENYDFSAMISVFILCKQTLMISSSFTFSRAPSTSVLKVLFSFSAFDGLWFAIRAKLYRTEFTEEISVLAVHGLASAAAIRPHKSYSSLKALISFIRFSRRLPVRIEKNMVPWSLIRFRQYLLQFLAKDFCPSHHGEKWSKKVGAKEEVLWIFSPNANISLSSNTFDNDLTLNNPVECMIIPPVSNFFSCSWDATPIDSRADCESKGLWDKRFGHTTLWIQIDLPNKQEALTFSIVGSIPIFLLALCLSHLEMRSWQPAIIIPQGQSLETHPLPSRFDAILVDVIRWRQRLDYTQNRMINKHCSYHVSSRLFNFGFRVLSLLYKGFTRSCKTSYLLAHLWLLTEVRDHSRHSQILTLVE